MITASAVIAWPDNRGEPGLLTGLWLDPFALVPPGPPGPKASGAYPGVMPKVNPDAPLSDNQVPVPVLWTVRTHGALFGEVDCSDEVMARYLGPGRGIKLKSFGHDGDGVHFLLTRAGTPLHTDTAYTRYSHQLVLRNDGNRIRGMPRYDHESLWHPPLWPGVMYCLDTHSPHQGTPDPRIAPAYVAKVRGLAPMLKAVIAVDRDRVLAPDEAWPLLRRFLKVQMADRSYDAALHSAPRAW